MWLYNYMYIRVKFIRNVGTKQYTITFPFYYHIIIPFKLGVCSYIHLSKDAHGLFSSPAVSL